MIKDAELRKRVIAELNYDARLDATHIGVATAQGVVTLSGDVPSYPELFTATKAVWRVEGVKAIVSQIKVRLPSENQRHDQDVAQSIVHVLEHNVNLPDSGIKAEVADGCVILGGEVEWDHQRRHVERQVAHISGVRDISNQIELKRRLVPEDVKEQIEEALLRNAQVEASKVFVEVVDDEVILSGNVKAFYERNLVEAAVWSAPGVHRVTDHITVG